MSYKLTYHRMCWTARLSLILYRKENTLVRGPPRFWTIAIFTMFWKISKFETNRSRRMKIDRKKYRFSLVHSEL